MVHEQMLSAFPGGLTALQLLVGWMNAFDIVLLCPDSHDGVNVVALKCLEEGLLGKCRATVSGFHCQHPACLCYNFMIYKNYLLNLMRRISIVHCPVQFVQLEPISFYWAGFSAGLSPCKARVPGQPVSSHASL